MVFPLVGEQSRTVTDSHSAQEGNPAFCNIAAVVVSLVLSEKLVQPLHAQSTTDQSAPLDTRRPCPCSNQETRLRVEAADERMTRINRKLDVMIKMMMGVMQGASRNAPHQVRSALTCPDRSAQAP
eukprot:scaffold215021_cov21-Tisochrysis_lutea.AAC.1